jgi:hypothetical protein
MLEFIQAIGVGEFIALVAICGGLLIPLVAIIGGLMYKSRKLHLENALKQQMIERGFTAEEIREVLRAPRAPKRDRKCSEV